MDYIAHKAKDGRTQSIKDHLEGTAKLAASFSIPMMKDLAYAAGYAHDIGKYTVAFQKRIRGENIAFEHALPGAIEYRTADNRNARNAMPEDMLAYCIAGHHTGLPDGGTDCDTPDDVTLTARLARQPNYTKDKDYTSFKNEISPPAVPETLTNELVRAANSSGTYNEDDLMEAYAFFTKYLFSCLTDADYLDTERFCRPDAVRETHADFRKAAAHLSVILDHLQENAATDLQIARSRLQAQAIAAAKTPCDISLLNMPTGSGKTFCSLNIALQKVIASQSSTHPKKRIIYVIPYTSVIEQTAALFEDIMGDYTDILQHHANYTYEDETEKDTAAKLRQAAENWDIPVIVTTSVQFFESLYHYRGSKLRKLHNMADSVIVLDEIHMLPVKLLQPCLRAIGYITKYLNSHAIFLSATMPDYSKLFSEYMPGCNTRALITDKQDFAYFKKCTYKNMGQTSIENVIRAASLCENSLIVVNKKKTAKEIYKLLDGKKFHLSAYMTPEHRHRMLEKIKQSLADNEHITVVSTSLIEVGVDLSFHTVFREITGLDSILQTGGRCNREGKARNGDVFVFDTGDRCSADMQVRISITNDLLQKYTDIDSPNCIEEYYDRLFAQNDKSMHEETLRSKGAVLSPRDMFLSIPFRSYADQFSLITDDTIGIVIDNNSITHNMIRQLQEGDTSAKRRLQKYTVPIKRREWEKAKDKNLISDTGAGVYVLNKPNLYDGALGLCLDTE